MSTPYVAYVATAGQRDFDVPFPFISRAHVKVRVNGAQVTPFSWPAAARLRLPFAATGGEAVEIERDTPVDTQLAQFQDGNILTAEDLNTATLQSLFKLQEVTGLYDRSLRQAQVRVGDSLGIVTNPEDVAQELAELVLEQQVLDDFRARIADIDLNANSILAQSVLIDQAFAAVVTEQTARTSADAALAEDITLVTTTVGENTAAVATLASSVNGLTARYGVSLDVNGYVTGFLQNNDGTSGSFTILADRFAVVTPGATPLVPFEIEGGVVRIREAAIGTLSVERLTSGDLSATITQNADWNVGTGRIVWDNGTHMKVAGVGFGSAGQFIEWFGPKMDIAFCSEANAITYLKTNGDAYFGGTLSAGILRNAAQSTDTGPAATVTIGPFGTNGNPIQIITSYSAESRDVASYPATGTGVTNWQSAVTAWGATPTGPAGSRTVNASKAIACNVVVRLDRTVGASTVNGWATLTITGGTETLVGFEPSTVDSIPGELVYTRIVTGSITSTDTAGGVQDRTFTATITTRTNATLGTILRQAVGIIATEE